MTENPLLTNQIICGDAALVLEKFPDNSIPLTITSPPYDDMRSYKGYDFNFEKIALQLFRVTKEGGVLVWVVGDKTENGTESGTSFSQALFFKSIGFNLHDTMIYQKPPVFPDERRYSQAFEYMFVLSKGEPKTINLIKDHKNKPDPHKGGELTSKARNVDGSISVGRRPIRKAFSTRWNIWQYSTGYMQSTTDKIAFDHPAMFPEQLAADHIISWSNPGDIVLDPMAGSGTTLKMAKLNRRNYIGIEISEEYCELIKKRLEKYNNDTLDKTFETNNG